MAMKASNLGALFTPYEDDIRGNIFVELAINKADPSKPALETIDTIMLGKYYKDGKVRDNEVHPAFKQLAEDVGKWHKILDNNTIGQNDLIKKWVNRVIRNLTPNEAAFYDKLMCVKVNGVCESVSSFQGRVKKGENVDNFMFNLKKEFDDQDIKYLVLQLNNEWSYHYENGYNTGGQVSGTKSLPIQADAILSALLHAEAPEPTEDRWLDGLLSNDQTVGRSNDGKMVDIRNKPFSDPELNEKCYSTGLNGNREECMSLLQDCFLNAGSDLSKCASNIDLLPSKVFEVRAEDVAQMNPQVAFKILSNLKFQGEHKHDMVSGRKLLKVQSFDSWLNNIQKDGSVHDTFKQAIKNNKAVRDYLTMVIDFVNANPSILNKDYAGVSDQANGMRTGYNLENRNKYGHVYFQTNYNLKSLSDVADRVKVNRAKLALVPVSGQLLTVGGYPLQQLGGGGDVFGKDHLKGDSGAATLNNIYLTNLGKLQNAGKDLSTHTKEVIQKEISNLLKTEAKVVKILNYLNRYTTAMRIAKDLAPEKHLTMDSIVRDLETKYNNILDRKERRELNLVSILEALVNAVSELNPMNKMKPLNTAF